LGGLFVDIVGMRTLKTLRRQCSGRHSSRTAPCVLRVLQQHH